MFMIKMCFIAVNKCSIVRFQEQKFGKALTYQTKENVWLIPSNVYKKKNQDKSLVL